MAPLHPILSLTSLGKNSTFATVGGAGFPPSNVCHLLGARIAFGLRKVGIRGSARMRVCHDVSLYFRVSLYRVPQSIGGRTHWGSKGITILSRKGVAEIMTLLMGG